MMGKITALRYQKRNQDRVNVYLDGTFAFGLAAVKAAHLKVGQTLDDAQIAELKQRDEVERAYERALNFLSYRPRSEEEVRRNLRRKDYAETTIEDAIYRLVQARLLDDAEFARYWVDNRQRFNPRGTRALRYELRKKGVSSHVIDKALVDFDETEAAQSVVEAGARRYSRLAPRDFRRKLQAYMARRGFSYGTIAPLVDDALETHCQALSDFEESEEYDE